MQHVDGLDLPLARLTEPVQRAIDRAAVDASRRGQVEVTTGHLFMALSQVEWQLFAEVMRDLNVNPHAVVAGIEAALGQPQAVSAAGLYAAPTTRLVFKLALQRATRAGRQMMGGADLLAAALADGDGVPATVCRSFGIDPADLEQRLDERAQSARACNEQSLKRFELPPYLRQLAVNLNQLAWQDVLPPVFGRDREIQQTLEILAHRDRPNSVMLLGEAGVGKTAIVEGLARRLELEPERVPARLRDCQIVSLQMNALVAGTMLRGMFEERLQNVIRELRERSNLILFIDEAHLMIGVGSAMGANADAANILKPVLARGELKVIAATTTGEYRQHLEEDDAFARRFRAVHVAEPTLGETRRILERLRPRLERNYGVRLLDEAIDTALDMSGRYLRHLRLPDKAIGWLDTAAVRTELERRWEVTRADVVGVIADAAQIPEDMVFREVTDRFAAIEDRLGQRVIGQPKALAAVAHRLLLNKGPLKGGFDRPDGVLLFVGPTGVGKTELAKAVAESLFGDERKIIRIDMSEFQDPRTGVDKLIGMPHGIVGSQRGGVLTNQLRENPYAVVLLDEVEKASPDVLNLFLQAFDEGWLTDGRGRRVYLSDAIVIMTSNVGSEHFRRLNSPLGFLSRDASVAQVQADIRREVERRFAPEFLNRIDEVVLFAPLARAHVRRIADQYLATVREAMAAAGRTLAVDDEALEAIVTRGHSVAFGARFLKRAIDEQIKLPISQHWRDAAHFHVRLKDGTVVVDEEPGACGEPAAVACPEVA